MSWICQASRYATRPARRMVLRRPEKLRQAVSVRKKKTMCGNIATCWPLIKANGRISTSRGAWSRREICLLMCECSRMQERSRLNTGMYFLGMPMIFYFWALHLCCFGFVIPSTLYCSWCHDFGTIILIVVDSAINLTKNSQFYVRQGDVERLIAQGYLQKLS